MKFYFGNVRSWNDANLELARLHALCDIVTDYANETSNDVKVKDNNISFALQIIHDLTAALEDEFEKFYDDPKNCERFEQWQKNRSEGGKSRE